MDPGCDSTRRIPGTKNVLGVAMLTTIVAIAIAPCTVRANSTTPVQAIVALDTPVLPETKLSDEAVQAQRERLARAGQDVAERARALAPGPWAAPRVLRAMPYVILSTSSTAATALKRAPNVTQVEIARRLTAVRGLSRKRPPQLRRRNLAKPRRPVARAAQQLPPSETLYDYGTGASVAWAWDYTGTGQTVAVLDLGMDATDPWFEGVTIEEACFSSSVTGRYESTCPTNPDPITGDRPPARGLLASYPSGIDPGVLSWWSRGHATTGAVTGAELREFGLPTALRGIAPDANLLSINISSRSGPTQATITEGDLIAGLDEVAANARRLKIRAATIGFSYQPPFTEPCDERPPTILQQAVNQVVANDVTVVFAAGDHGTSNLLGDHLGEPACYSKVVAVGALDDEGQPAPFSAYGPLVSMYAPGTDFALPTLTRTISDERWSTSISAAVVAGAVALYKQKAPMPLPRRSSAS